jgi:hypothetical protein
LAAPTGPERAARLAAVRLIRHDRAGHA